VTDDEVMRYTNAHVEGFEAYLNGGDVEDNPHREDPYARRGWHDGWCDARDAAADAGQAVSTGP
jgi:ribosome modulation factor